MTSIMDNFEGHLGAFVAEEGIYSLEHLMRKAGFGAALSPEPSDTDSAEDGGFDRIASPQSKADRRAAKRRAGGRATPSPTRPTWRAARSGRRGGAPRCTR